MSDLTDRLRRTKKVEQRCCNCGHTMKGYSRLRYTGFTTTHSHGDCIRLLHADAEEAADTIQSQAAEIERLRKWNADMVAKAAGGGVLDGYREMGAKLAAKDAEIERLRAALDNIATYLPTFDYAARDGYGNPDPNAPGSPFDRGRDQEARHLSAIARAALGEDG